MNIYIIVENPKRELDSRIYLALMLIRMGYKVYIVKKTRLFEKLDIIDPGVLFFKSFGPGYERYIDEIKKCNHVITGIDEEGLQLYSDVTLIGNMRFSKKTIRDSKIIYTWGNDSKEIYKKAVNKSLILKNSGNPRIDLIKDTKKVYAKAATDLKKKYGKFILIPTQFLKANPASGKKLISFFKIPKNSTLSKLEKLRYNNSFKYQKISLKKYEELYSFLSKNYPEKNFIIRPHPAESLSYYKKLNKKYKNIKVVADNLPINPWILASELVISNNCTTAIEAYFIKGKSINYIPYKDLQSEYYLNKKLSIESRNLKHLSKLLSKNNLNKIKINKKNLKEIKSMIHNSDKVNSCEIIGKSLLKIYKKKFSSKRNISRSKLFYNYLMFFLKSKISQLKAFLFNRNQPEYLNQLNKKGLNKEKVQERILTLSRANTLGGKYGVSEKYYGIFSIKQIKEF